MTIYLPLLLQASGEAQYTSDIPPLPNELAAAFILTTQVSNNLSFFFADNIFDLNEALLVYHCCG